MRILKLKADNIKRLVAVEIAPKGDVVKITGRNGAGKSSVLDAIWWALGGADNIQSAPIRKGETKAQITLEIGDLVVTRRFTARNSYLEVTNAQGAKYSSPQRMLDELVGRMSFDPLQFMRMRPADQAQTLRELTGVDVRSLDTERERVYQERRDVNRQLKAEHTRAADAASAAPTQDPGDERTVTAVLEEIERAREHNAGIDELHVKLAATNKRIGHVRSNIEDLEAQLTEARERAAKLDAEIESLDDQISASKRMDIDPLRDKLAAVEEHNAAVRAWRAAWKARESEMALESEADALSKRIAEIDSAKAEMLASAEMPVEGLSFASGGIEYKGIPLEQASQAEQLRVSLAMAMSANPKLRVIRITDGSLLDSDSMRVIEEMAHERDYQIWIEVVDESGKIGVYIKDGMVAGEAE